MTRPDLLFVHERGGTFERATHHKVAPAAGWRTFVAGWRDIETGRGATILHGGTEILPGGRARTLSAPERIEPAAIVHRTWVHGGCARTITGLATSHPRALVSHHPLWAHFSDKRDGELAFRAGDSAGLEVPRPRSFLPRPGHVRADLAAAGAAGPLILKPARGTMCLGILLSTPSTFAAVAAQADRPPRRWLAQELVLDAAQIDGCKVDLRVFALVTSVRPLRMRVFREGVARVAARPFAPGEPDLPAAALTGASFRKREGLPIRNLLISEFVEQLRARGVAVGDDPWARIEQVCRAAFACYAGTPRAASAVDLGRRICVAGLDLLPVVRRGRLELLYLEMNAYAQLNGWGAAVDRGLVGVHRAWLEELAELAAGGDAFVTAA